ncbi:MAG TPA: phosphatidylserine decarboxylase family protein [Bacteroidales bacterium]|nr:phosphatidylserine decarboxylase family protein [Bacteroidales bacterium]HPE57235.1 phosphatidylserine decarboxylase family protein [Bacteroidales bacterium]
MAVRLHKEGFPVMILVLFLLITIALIINLIEPTQTIIHVILYAAALIFYFYVVRFFRNPIREVVPDDNIILSGADGTVVVIEDVVETEYFKDKRKQVSVFMSPTNVHVNWYPISGKIVYFRHNQGSYFIASKPKSSNENERTSIVIQTESGHEIMFRQIAGTVARRIVCYAKEGKQVKQGDQLGIIKFGSRFDFFLPVDMPVSVTIGDKVSGNISTIAKII